MSAPPTWEHKPGSPEATAAGCLCPVIDNARGAGVRWGGETSWWVNGECPLHGQPPADAQAVAFK